MKLSFFLLCALAALSLGVIVTATSLKEAAAASSAANAARVKQQQEQQQQQPDSTFSVNADLLFKRDQHTAFHTATAHRDFATHAEFLTQQTVLFWPQLAARIDAHLAAKSIRVAPAPSAASKLGATGVAGVEPFTFVDLGSGPCALGALVLQRYPAQATVQCVDVDHNLLLKGEQRFLPYANTLGAAGDVSSKQRLNFVHASANSTGLDQGSADIVVAQFLIQVRNHSMKHQYSKTTGTHSHILCTLLKLLFFSHSQLCTCVYIFTSLPSSCLLPCVSQHVYNPRSVVAEVTRILAPGGAFFVLDSD